MNADINMNNKTLGMLALSQLALGGFLLVCVVIAPKFALDANEGGVSNYGVQLDTIVPYTLAFSLAGLLIWLSGRALPPAVRSYSALRRSFAIVASLYLLVLVSTYPYKVTPLFDDIHLASALLLAGAELILLTWMAFVLCRSRSQMALWLIGFSGYVILATTALRISHLLLVGQVITAAGFAALTLRVTSQLINGAQADP